MGNDEKDRIRQVFAARFRKALNELGYLPNDQAKLGALFGVSGQAVRKWAEGLALPTPSRMPHVAGVLGVRRAWLQDGEEPMRPTTARVERAGRYDAKGLSLTADEAKVLAMYRTLSPKERETLRNLMVMISKGRKR